jgi:hypothetical protein
MTGSDENVTPGMAMVYMAATVVSLSSGAMILLTLAYTMIVDGLGGGKGADQALAYEPIPEKPQASLSPVATRTRTRAARA